MPARSCSDRILKPPTARNLFPGEHLSSNGSDEFAIEQPHHDVVMPGTVHERGFALASFDDEPAFLVGAQRPRIVCDDTYRDAVELRDVEGVVQDETHGFRAEP